MMRELGKSLGDAVFERLGRASGRVQERRPLPVDLLEDDDAYLAVFDAPGATASDVQVRYADNSVEVRIDRFREFHEEFEMRYPGRGLSLDGRVELPADARVDPDAASATLRENGTLEVRVPKLADDSTDGDEGSGVAEDDAGGADADPTGE
ncbi:MAG: Hsp20/alpha crystallin family protein [Haloarculaceae archaeon]